MSEWLGRAAAAVLVAGPAAATQLAPGPGRGAAVALRATLPEAGGWQPAALTATVGEPLVLRLTSDDVVHSFAIGRDSAPPVDVEPGKATTLTLRFDRPGAYAFYCTRWCGPNHWRMRGTIDVRGPGPAGDSAPPAPYLAQGLDLDAPHPATPASQAVAAAWLRAASPAAIRTGRRLYARNCAACHGESGRGDGVMLPALRASLGVGDAAPAHDARAPAVARPPDFTASDLLGAAPVLLHGKIVRGGMGTGMPAWGPVLTDRETWALVSFLYPFQLANHKENR